MPSGKNRNLPGHAWRVLGRRAGWFIYGCTVCGCRTLNGVPLPTPYDTECVK